MSNQKRFFLASILFTFILFSLAEAATVKTYEYTGAWIWTNSTSSWGGNWVTDRTNFRIDLVLKLSFDGGEPTNSFDHANFVSMSGSVGTSVHLWDITSISGNVSGSDTSGFLFGEFSTLDIILKDSNGVESAGRLDLLGNDITIYNDGASGAHENLRANDGLLGNGTTTYTEIWHQDSDYSFPWMYILLF